MQDKKISPGEQAAPEPEDDVEGHKRIRAYDDEPGQTGVLPRWPATGGEAIPDEDDVEGHKRR
jgi:hypothetical protein